MNANTNIKNLPAGQYFTEVGYTQLYPWVEVARTMKTVTLAKVDVVADPEWKPNMIPGGFCAHCVNQGDQTWLFDKVNMNNVKKVYATKDGKWGKGGVKFVEGMAKEFYDYNF